MYVRKGYHPIVKHFVDGEPAVKVAERNGVKAHTFYIRMYKFGWDAEKAVLNREQLKEYNDGGDSRTA